MSLNEKKFDVIIIGTEAQRQKAIELLNSHGIRAGYIPLVPASMSTIVCQKWNNIPFERDAEYELVLQQHSFHTQQGETITYTMQVQAMEQEAEEPEDELTFIEVSSEETWDNDEDEEVFETLSAKFELDEESEVLAESEEEFDQFDQNEAVEAEEAEMEEEAETVDPDSSASHPQTMSVPFYSPDELLAGKSLLWDRERSLQRRPSVNLLQSSLLGPQIFKLGEEKKQETEPSLLKDKPERSEEPVQSEQEKPIQHETFAAKDINRESASHIQTEMIGEEEKKEETAPLFERELRLRKRLLSSNYRMKHRIQQSVLNTVEANEQQDEAEPQEETQEPGMAEVYPIQPLSLRRRSRVHKKSRMLSNIELTRKTPEPQPEKPAPAPSILRKDEPMFEPDFADNPVDDQETMGTEPLKRDTIEFEEPFGNTWEDFLEPYPQGNRKRQELDKIEKRKIALRGLHNLINQLG